MIQNSRSKEKKQLFFSFLLVLFFVIVILLQEIEVNRIFVALITHRSLNGWFISFSYLILTFQNPGGFSWS